mgnify:CR=1 FL=1
MNHVDMAKARRESIRWTILLILNNARPVLTHENLVLTTMQGIFADATANEMRRELDYLEERELVKIKREPSGVWLAELTRLGVDVAEYTVDVEPGIARPAKFWPS